jgi:hypothetical protein
VDSSAQATASKAAFKRFHDAANAGDLEVIAKAIDEVVAPDVRFPAPVPAGGRIAEIWGVVDVYAQPRQLGLAKGKTGERNER